MLRHITLINCVKHWRNEKDSKQRFLRRIIVVLTEIRIRIEVKKVTKLRVYLFLYNLNALIQKQTI